MTRAIGLLSGGLDSLLAVRVLLDQHIEILAISFVTPFFNSRKGAQAATTLDVPFRSIDITDEHLRMMRHPKHGFGRNMNPCVDCHTLMLKIAGGVMEAEGYDFLFTGEVLGERPKSQNRRALDIVAKESGYPDLVLRPLSAKHLEPTRPERDGVIDRERLLDFHGRSRKPQLALAEKYGITEFPTPAGGCLLTDPRYSRKLRELWEKSPDASVDDIRLLAVGRHLRLSDTTKLVIGRKKEENDRLDALMRPRDTRLFVFGVPGPVGILRGPADENTRRLAAEITARYSDAPADARVTVVLTTGGVDAQLTVTPANRDATASLLI